MKRNNIFVWLVFIWIVSPMNILAQDFYDFTTKGACHGLDNGTLELNLNESIITSTVDVSFPITIYVEDLCDGSVE